MLGGRRNTSIAVSTDSFLMAALFALVCLRCSRICESKPDNGELICLEVMMPHLRCTEVNRNPEATISTRNSHPANYVFVISK